MPQKTLHIEPLETQSLGIEPVNGLHIEPLEQKPEEKTFLQQMTSAPNLVRFGASTLGDLLMPFTFGASPFIGGALGEGAARWMEGQPFDPSIMALEGGLNYLPGGGKLERTALKDIGKYAIKSGLHGSVQGLVGSVPRHLAAEGTLYEPGKWELPSEEEVVGQTLGGGVVGTVLGGAFGLHGKYRGKAPQAPPAVETPPPTPKPRISAAEFAAMRDARPPAPPTAPTPTIGHRIENRFPSAVENELLKRQGYVPIDERSPAGYGQMELRNPPEEQLPIPEGPIRVSGTEQELTTPDVGMYKDIPIDRVDDTYIANMKAAGMRLAGKVSNTVVRFVKDEEGTFDPQQMWTNLKRLLGRDPTPEEVEAGMARQVKPGEPTGRVAQFEQPPTETNVVNLGDPNVMQMAHETGTFESLIDRALYIDNPGTVRVDMEEKIRSATPEELENIIANLNQLNRHFDAYPNLKTRKGPIFEGLVEFAQHNLESPRQQPGPSEQAWIDEQNQNPPTEDLDTLRRSLDLLDQAQRNHDYVMSQLDPQVEEVIRLAFRDATSLEDAKARFDDIAIPQGLDSRQRVNGHGRLEYLFGQFDPNPPPPWGPQHPTAYPDNVIPGIDQPRPIQSGQQELPLIGGMAADQMDLTGGYMNDVLGDMRARARLQRIGGEELGLTSQGPEQQPELPGLDVTEEVRPRAYGYEEEAPQQLDIFEAPRAGEGRRQMFGGRIPGPETMSNEPFRLNPNESANEIRLLNEYYNKTFNRDVTPDEIDAYFRFAWGMKQPEQQMLPHPGGMGPGDESVGRVFGGENYIGSEPGLRGPRAQPFETIGGDLRFPEAVELARSRQLRRDIEAGDPNQLEGLWNLGYEQQNLPMDRSSEQLDLPFRRGEIPFNDRIREPEIETPPTTGEQLDLGDAEIRDYLRQEDARPPESQDIRMPPEITDLGPTKDFLQAGPVPTTSPTAKKTKGKESWGRQLWHAPRGIMASMDLSAPLRQGLPMIHTKEFWTSLVPMVKSAMPGSGGEAVFNKIIQDIKARPEFQRPFDPMTGKWGKSQAEIDGLKLPGITEGLTSREENIAGELIGKIPGIKHSNRAYVAYLNSLRADSYRALIKDAQGLGLNPKTDATLGKAIAGYVNTATGRGSLGMLEPHAKLLSDVLFAPRLMASRVQMLNPANYIMGPDFVRKQYMMSALATATAWSSFASLAYIAGADVSLDPESSDFGKIRIGNTRLDPAGGFQQYIVALTRLVRGSTQTSGKRYETGGNFPAPTRFDVASNFALNKANPAMDFALDLLRASRQRPMFVTDRIAQMFVPMVVTDVMELASENPEMLPTVIPTIFGMSSQTYERGKEQPKILSRRSVFGNLRPYAGEFRGGRILP